MFFIFENEKPMAEDILPHPTEYRNKFAVTNLDDHT